jgi:cytidylate kinase
MATLRTRDLTKSYSGRTVVRGVSLEIASGEVVGLLGPNGAGKTTTFSMVVGLTAPDSGRVLLDGADVTDAIRTPEVSRAASRHAADPAVRAAMAARQRALLADGDWVAEGRDIGTVIAPHAELKVWLDASLAERARRRELPEEEVAERDRRDASREHSPMVSAPDAVHVDTTGLTIAEVVQQVVGLARERAGRP